MSQGILGNARPTIFNCETVCDQRGEVVREIDSADPTEADAHWVALSNVEELPPEPWVPVRLFFGKGHRETEQVYPPIPWDRTQLLSRSGKRGFSITPRGGEG